MGIRLKNKYISVIAFVLGAYFIGFGFLCGLDFFRNNSYYEKDYFESYNFENQMTDFCNSLETYYFQGQEYDYNTKTLIDKEKAPIDRKDIKYYLSSADGKVYSNIGKKANLKKYAGRKSLAFIYIPMGKDAAYDSKFSNVISFLSKHSLGGYIIVPKAKNDSYYPVYQDYNQFNRAKDKFWNKMIMGLGCFVLGIVLVVLFHSAVLQTSRFFKNIVQLFNTQTIDLRIIIFLFGCLELLDVSGYGGEYSDTFIGYTIGDKTALAFGFIFIWILLFALELISIIINIDTLVKEIKRSLVFRFYLHLRETMENVNIFLMATFLFGTTFLFGFCSVSIIGVGSDTFVTGCLCYITIYIIFIPKLILKQLKMLNKIVNGTDEIASGNLNFVIDATGNGELSRLSKNINNIRDGFKDSVDSQLKSERLKTELITNVSHDLKSPLTSIINYVDILKRDNLSEEERRDYISILDKKSTRLKILIEDLFDISKISSGSVELNLEKMNVAELLNQALGEFDEKIKNSSLIFKVNILDETACAVLDGKKTWRVFENLISNILKYSQTNSRVYIDLKKVDNKIQVIMRNISAYEMNFSSDEIFERFKRGDAARSTEGSGLGLSIAKSIVELEGGTLHLTIDGDLFKVVVSFSCCG